MKKGTRYALTWITWSAGYPLIKHKLIGIYDTKRQAYDTIEKDLKDFWDWVNENAVVTKSEVDEFGATIEVVPTDIGIFVSYLYIIDEVEVK